MCGHIEINSELSMLIENTSDIIIVTSTDLKIFAFNKNAEFIFNLPENDAIGKNWYELFSLLRVKTPITSDYMKNPRELNKKIEFFDKNKKKWMIDWKLRPCLNTQKNIKFIMAIATLEPYAIGIEQDITLEQIVECSPGSLYWKDKQGRYLGCNMFMVKQAGLKTTKDIIGKTDFDLWPENAEKIFENDQSVITTGKTVFIEEEVKIASGEILYFTGVKMPLMDTYGNIIGIICNSLDITKLRLTELALRKAKEETELANQIKTDFIRNLEHDIRTPFNGIWGMAKILSEREVDVQKKEFLTDIANAAKELFDYCNSILDFSKIEAGLPIISKVFNLSQLANGVILMETPPAKARKLELTWSYDAILPTLLIGDAYRIKCILINLLSNAIKFTHTGFVKLSIGLATVKNTARESMVQLSIEDSGIGIPEDKKDFIYECFSKISPSNKGIYKGQGLGLKVVKQFVNDLDGEIHLETKLGKGSKFNILLPLKVASSEQIN